MTKMPQAFFRVKSARSIGRESSLSDGMTDFRKQASGEGRALLETQPTRNKQ